MPNFLIIGAAKSGTTALYHYIRQHPDVYLASLKEPNFFAFEGQELNFRGPGVTVNTSITTLPAYLALFENVSGEHAIGEASTTYLHVPEAPPRIHRSIPDARLIAILRNPVDRAYSSFLHLMREGREPCWDFRRALEMEPARIQENWGFLWRYVELGLYYEQLKRYMDLFPSAQLRVLLYDDFRDNPAKVLAELFRFLDVDDQFVPNTSVRPNVSGRHRSPILQRVLAKTSVPRALARHLLPQPLRRAVKTELKRRLVKPELRSELRSELQARFRDDILKTEHLIQRDLSAWLR